VAAQVLEKSFAFIFDVRIFFKTKRGMFHPQTMDDGSH